MKNPRERNGLEDGRTLEFIARNIMPDSDPKEHEVTLGKMSGDHANGSRSYLTMLKKND